MSRTPFATPIATRIATRIAAFCCALVCTVVVVGAQLGIADGYGSTDGGLLARAEMLLAQTTQSASA